MTGHGAAVVVDVVAALAIGEDLGALDEAGRRGWAWLGPADLDGLGVDEGRAAGQRDALEVLHVMPRRDVAGVAPGSASAHPGLRR